MPSGRMKNPATPRARTNRNNGHGDTLPAQDVPVPRKLRVCHVQSYRAPDYIRGTSICAALARMPGVELVTATNRSPGPGRYLETIRRLVRVKKSVDPDVFILGFRGHEIAWLVRWLTKGKPLILDAMMSPYAALREERKLGLPGRLLAPLWGGYERSILHAADAVLTDTELHARYYRDEFGLATDRILALPVGAVELPDLPSKDPPVSPQPPGSSFRVLFYGSFLPLHGIDVILDAVASLADLPIELQFVGGTPRQAKRLVTACATRGITRYQHHAWIPFDRLLHDEIQRADLCLGGPFGGTPQAQRVVTGKTSQCLAAGKATVIGRIEEDHGFVDRFNCLLVRQNDAVALAAAIRWSHANRACLHEIGQRGQALYAERLSVRVIADRLRPLLMRLAYPGRFQGAPCQPTIR